MTMLLEQPALAKPLERMSDALFALPMALYRWQPTLLGILAFVLYIFIVMVVCAVQPQTDWDVLAYVAIAAERSYDTPAALHAYAYDVLKAGVTPAQFTLLTEDGSYRSQMFADPAGFVSMLGMYRVKWLYCELLALLTHVVPPLEASRLVSALSALAFAGVSLLWLKAEKALALAPAFVAILIVAGYGEIARFNSPDMLFSALLMGGLYCHVRGFNIASFLLLFAGFLARPDNVIFLGMLSVLLLLYRQWSWGVFAAFIAAAVLFVPLNMMTGQPGWWAQLYFASIEHQNTLEGFKPAFSIALYIGAAAKQFVLALTSQSWIGVFILGLATWFATDRAGLKLNRRRRILMLAVVFAIIAKFILVPIFDTRIYFPYVIAIFLILSGPLTNWPYRQPVQDGSAT